ncbi:hypothetical protein CJF42_00280 [Pseudoalteromonas sp. NBT06-2]|uniref:alpha/beta fold hydrolase n=1 Tax=Pseudoalteromonas sp. NBT06-2 TaxID=2025950 RepID=UPI000BA73F53|nr:alpha/beta hydrolase [Pseudoalteromonas sp. NBT06-2]PAJ76373.1 hypothetical protein CJF42_00280 [Pseudoalteromonas sp. NBT06-2]
MKADVYLLPGTMCNEMLWHDLQDVICDEVTLNHIELPSGDTIDEITDGLLSVLPNKKVNLIGFSMGGYIACYFATKFPNRVKKLFIISNTPCELNDNELKQRETAVEWLKLYGYSGISRKKAANMVDENQQDERVIKKIIAMDKQLGESVFLSQILVTTNRADLTNKLINTKIDITFYFSEYDTLINKVWLANYHKLNDNAKVIKQIGSGHMLPLEQPLLLKGYIENWLVE